MSAIGILTTITLSWTASISSTVNTNEKELAARKTVIEQAGDGVKKNTEKIEELDKKVEAIDDKVDRIQMLQELDLRSRGIPIPNER